MIYCYQVKQTNKRNAQRIVNMNNETPKTTRQDIWNDMFGSTSNEEVTKLRNEATSINESPKTIIIDGDDDNQFIEIEIEEEEVVEDSDAVGNKAKPKTQVAQLIENGYAETHVGYHAEYRLWNGTEQRGCYAQIAAPYGGTVRIYERSYEELLISVYEYLAS